jgi:uncharacterized protein (TIGR02444 family)
LSDALPLAGPHWSFALALYARPGVADACLKLQDALGVDVNVLLFALYAASERGMAFAPEEIAAIDGAVAEWRDEVVVKLRAIRRGLKAGPPPAPGPDTEALRDLVKKAELRAEQIEQAVLAQWLDENAPRARPQPGAAREIVAAVAAFYAGRCGREASLPHPELKAALDLIARADEASRPPASSSSRPEQRSR